MRQHGQVQGHHRIATVSRGYGVGVSSASIESLQAEGVGLALADACIHRRKGMRPHGQVQGHHRVATVSRGYRVGIGSVGREGLRAEGVGLALTDARCDGF